MHCLRYSVITFARLMQRLFSPSGWGLILTLFAARTFYGLCSEFWFEDELQIYLIGLKWFAGGQWPCFGPDVVYTQTQIPGALQGLMVGAGFFLAPLPESPIVVLNLLNMASITALAWYLSKRLEGLSFRFILIWVSFLPWTVYYGTRVVNVSYVLIFSIPFFIALLETLPVYERRLMRPKWAFFIMGLVFFAMMQLHLSFVLLIPLVAMAVYFHLRENIPFRQRWTVFGFFLAGSLLGISTLIPTWFQPPLPKNVAANVVWAGENIAQVGVILARYLSFASFEIPYVLGGNTDERLAVIREHVWMAPFAVWLLILGFALIGAMVFTFFRRRDKGPWLAIKWLTLSVYLLVFASFFFSIKGPSSHTFYIVAPLPIVYSLYVYDWLVRNNPIWRKILLSALLAAAFFYAGLAAYNLRHKSIYKDRERVQRAIDQKDHHILGTRRAEIWGYGY